MGCFLSGLFFESGCSLSQGCNHALKVRASKVRASKIGESKVGETESG